MQVIDSFRDRLVAYVQFLLEKVPAAVLMLIFGWLAIKLLTLIVDKALKAAKAESTIPACSAPPSARPVGSSSSGPR